MTNDYLKGWRYKLRTDRNARKRRAPTIRRKVESFRSNSRARRCASRARTPHAGPLEVHHVGGLRAGARLVWMCRRHNRAAAGQNAGRRRR